MKVLILRPEPGASTTAARAAAIGLQPVVAPLFEIRSVGWSPLPEDGAAIVITSANAIRHGGEGLEPLKGRSVIAVGGATAGCARAAGFVSVREAGGDVRAVEALLAEVGGPPAHHLCGADHKRVAGAVPTVVYKAEAVKVLPGLVEPGVALLHSDRAARVFGDLIDDAGFPRAMFKVAAISEGVAIVAGDGWDCVKFAEVPTDHAVLAVAARLCDQACRSNDER